jgi:hypothetical protein
MSLQQTEKKILRTNVPFLFNYEQGQLCLRNFLSTKDRNQQSNQTTFDQKQKTTVV